MTDDIQDLPEKHLTDVGTRYEHLRQMAEEWAAGIEVIEQMKYKTDEDKEKLKSLKAGIELIEKRLTSMSGYFDQVYRLGCMIDRIGRDEVNNLANGRGTPLIRPKHQLQLQPGMNCEDMS